MSVESLSQFNTRQILSAGPLADSQPSAALSIKLPFHQEFRRMSPLVAQLVLINFRAQISIHLNKMITIVTSRGTLQYPPGCKLDKASIVNYVSHLLGMDSAFFVLSFKDKQEDVIALDTDDDFEALRTLRSSGLDSVEITVESVSDQKLPVLEEGVNTDTGKTSSPAPVEAPAETPAKTPEEKAAAEAKRLERQKQKQLERAQAQEELKKKREQKQQEAKLLKEQKLKEKEALLKAKKEAKEAKEEELKKKEAKKEAKKEGKKEDEKQHKSVEKNTDAKQTAEVKKPTKQAFLQTNPFKQLGICTGCDLSPIGFPLFRCIECQRFTLCLNCQAKWSHEHPLLKIRKPQELPLLVISVSRQQVEPNPDEEEFIANLKNAAVEKLKLAHKHKVKLIKDDRLHIKQQEKEKEREAARVQKEKEKAALREKAKAEKAEQHAEKVALKAGAKKEEKKEEEPVESAPISYPSIA